MMFSQSKPKTNLLSQQIIIGKPYIFDVYIIKTEAMSLGQFNMTDKVICKITDQLLLNLNNYYRPA